MTHGRMEKVKECERRERSEEREELREISRIDEEEQTQTRKEWRVTVKWKMGSAREVVETSMGSRVPPFILSAAKDYHSQTEE